MLWEFRRELTPFSTFAPQGAQHQDFRAWFQIIRRVRRDARRIDIASMPLFPGYLFVELGQEPKNLGDINGTYGARRLLAFDRYLGILSEQFVADLRNPVGQNDGHVLTLRALRPGSRVRIVSGAFDVPGCVNSQGSKSCAS